MPVKNSAHRQGRGVFAALLFQQNRSLVQRRAALDSLCSLGLKAGLIGFYPCFDLNRDWLGVCGGGCDGEKQRAWVTTDRLKAILVRYLKIPADMSGLHR